MDNFLATLRNKGYKLTPQRRAVVNALFHCGKFPTALQILAHVKASAPDVSLDTIYRNLSLLADLGLICEIKLRGRDASVFEVLNGGHHHHHLVCLSCGQTECMKCCPIDERTFAEASDQGFEVVSHSLEFYGYCRTCRTAG